MKKFECKSGAANCPALEDQSMEFCTSCGEWLGLSLQDLEKENSIQEDVIRRTTRVPEQLLNKPLSTYGATPLPSRKEVPGIRAVFFLTFLIPVIALASYFYNLNISEEIIEQVEVVQQITTTSSTTTVQDILRKAYPIGCSASSSYGDGDGYSCENLYDQDPSSWQDNTLQCKDGWVEFSFAQEIYIDFIVFQNLEDSKSFKRNFKARDIAITTTDSEFLFNKELENDNTSQWIDINQTTSYLKIDILSAFPGEDVGTNEAFDECAIQEITFYGRG